MTFKEKLARDYPDRVNPSYVGGCKSCPINYGYESKISSTKACSTNDCEACWNREMPEITNTKEDGNMKNEKFTKKDLKPGHVIKLRDGGLYMVMLNNRDVLIATSAKDKWCDLTNDYTDDLRYNKDLSLPECEIDIVEVYGLCTYNYKALHVTTDSRDLLWKREPEKTCDDCAHKVVCTHAGMCEHFMEKK